MFSDEYWLGLAQRDLAFDGLGETDYRGYCCNCPYRTRASKDQKTVERLTAVHKQKMLHMLIIITHSTSVSVLTWNLQSSLNLAGNLPLEPDW